MTSENDDIEGELPPGDANGATVRRDVQTKLGEKLKEVYADVVNEPVPDRFVDLLNQLEQSEKNKSG